MWCMSWGGKLSLHSTQGTATMIHRPLDLR